MRRMFLSKVVSIAVLIAFFSVVCFPASPAPVNNKQTVKTENREKVTAQEAKGKSETESETAIDEYYSKSEANVIEDEGYPGKKKKKFPWLLVVGGVVVTGAVLFLLLKKDTYDITGNWGITITIEGVPIVLNYTFSGSKTSGTFIDEEGDSGTYTVDGKSVSFTYDLYAIQFTGEFSDKDHMGGTVTGIGVSWPWTGSRGGPGGGIVKTGVKESGKSKLDSLKDKGKIDH